MYYSLTCMHRCVYIYYDSADIHGCIRNDSKWGTPEFVKLGLLNKLSTRDIALDFGLPFPIGRIYWYMLLFNYESGWQTQFSYICVWKFLPWHQNKYWDTAINEHKFKVQNTEGSNHSLYGRHGHSLYSMSLVARVISAHMWPKTTHTHAVTVLQCWVRVFVN